MKGLKTYLSGLLAALMGLVLLYSPPSVPIEPWFPQGLIVAGLVTMGVRGFMGAKAGN